MKYSQSISDLKQDGHKKGAVPEILHEQKEQKLMNSESKTKQVGSKDFGDKVAKNSAKGPIAPYSSYKPQPHASNANDDYAAKQQFHRSL